MNTLEYKGYVAQIEYDREANVLVGHILGLRDTVVFETPRADEVEKTFHETVDDYLAYCAERGKEPDKPFSGRLVFRTTPERHRGMAMAAAQVGASLNAWLDSAVAAALSEHQRRHSTLRYINEHPRYDTGASVLPGGPARQKTDTQDTAERLAY